MVTNPSAYIFFLTRSSSFSVCGGAQQPKQQQEEGCARWNSGSGTRQTRSFYVINSAILCHIFGSSSLLLQTRRRAAKKRFEFCHLRPPRLRPNNLTSDGKGRIAKASGIRRMTEIRGVPRATKMRKSRILCSATAADRGCSGGERAQYGEAIVPTLSRQLSNEVLCEP